MKIREDNLSKKKGSCKDHEMSCLRDRKQARLARGG